MAHTVTGTLTAGTASGFDSISRSHIEADVFKSLRVLINGSLPSYTDTDSSTATYTLVSSYPEINQPFPMIVLNPSMISTNLLTMDGATDDEEIRVDFEIYAPARDHKQAIDVASERIRKIVKDNVTMAISTRAAASPTTINMTLTRTGHTTQTVTIRNEENNELGTATSDGSGNYTIDIDASPFTTDSSASGDRITVEVAGYTTWDLFLKSYSTTNVDAFTEGDRLINMSKATAIFGLK